MMRYGSQRLGRQQSQRRERDDRAWQDDRNWGRDDRFEPTYPRAYDNDYGRIEMGRAPDTFYGSGMNYSRTDYYSDADRDERKGGFMDSVKSFFGVGPKGYKRSDDRIKEEVSEALARDPQVDASDIEVDVVEGFVTLKGTVENRMMKRQAEMCIENISGVDDVHNLIRISPSTKIGIDADTSANLTARPKTSGSSRSSDLKV